MRIVKLLIPFLFFSCNSTNQEGLKVLGKLDLKEVSGLEYIAETQKLWAIEDSGNKNIIYNLDQNGDVTHKVEITNVKNIDWEDITSDTEGNLYIGDFGNNDNDRTNLAIHKVNKTDLDEKEVEASYTVSFYYPQQKEFPPKRSQMFFDVESFFELNGNFYLFTKNRSAKFEGDFYVYKVPNKEGNHAAQLITTLNSCKVFSKCAITTTDISPDGKTIVLLAADKIWLLSNFENDNFLQENMVQYPLGDFSQKEGVCFKDNNTLLIADEKSNKTGGKLYEFNLNPLKSKQ